MAACRSAAEWKTPCLSLRRVSVAKEPSTALSQEQEVGVDGPVARLLPALSRLGDLSRHNGLRPGLAQEEKDAGGGNLDPNQFKIGQ